MLVFFPSKIQGMTGEHGLSRAHGHIKAYGFSLFPHQRKFCSVGLLGGHILCMLGRTLIVCSCGKRWLCTCTLFEVPLVLKFGKITGPTFMSITCLPAHVYTLYPCAERHNTVYFPVFIHPSCPCCFRYGAAC